MAHQAALQLYPQALVATPMSVGISGALDGIHGTLSLRPETFTVAYDGMRIAKAIRVEHILICNGHAGNGPLRDQVADFSEKLGIDVQFHSYWEAYSKEFVDEILIQKTVRFVAAGV